MARLHVLYFPQHLTCTENVSDHRSSTGVTTSATPLDDQGAFMETVRVKGNVHVCVLEVEGRMVCVHIFSSDTGLFHRHSTTAVMAQCELRSVSQHQILCCMARNALLEDIIILF